jgi:peptidoglycan/xylan/chitin deacetylase (PgdA/CDA1 family)
MVGNRLNSYKGTVKRIAKQGHELGYHSYSHQTQTKLSNSKIKSDYNKSNQILNNLTGESFTLWRTPGGAYSSRVLKNIPLPHILWSVDTRDWETRNATKVYRSIINNAKDGAVILLHDLHKTSVEGSIKAMEDMIEGDYEFLTVTELLSRNGTPPVIHKSYKKAPK